MRNHFIQGLEKLAAKDRHIYLMTGDLGYGVLDSFAMRFPSQFINAGISEQNMTAVAAGLALEGNTVYTYSIGNFPTLRCLEQIRNDICYHNANVKIVAVGAGLSYGQLGMSHHATEDIAIMRALPNMRVFSPADSLEAMAVLSAVHKIDGPCYIRLGKGKEPDLHPELPVQDVTKILRIRSGSAVSIYATGTILNEGLRAAGQLNLKGLSTEINSVITIKPLDTETILQSAQSHKLLVSLEEHNVNGGLGGAIAECLATSGAAHAPLIRIGLEDIYTSVVGDQMFLQRYYGMDAESIVKRVEEECKKLV